MKTLIQVLKSILKSLIIWAGLTIIALTVDSIFHLSQKSDGFTAVFVTVPIIVAVWGPSRKLIRLAWSVEKSRPKNPQTDIETPSLKTEPDSPTLVQPPVTRSVSMSSIDKMDGHDFEEFTADLLRKLGYENVRVTRGSGDQGVDVLAVKNGKTYGIQCKRYNQKLGNKPVQEVFAGKAIYGCSVAVVLTNNYFTDGAKEAAKATGVELWDRDTLRRMLVYAENRERGAATVLEG